MDESKFPVNRIKDYPFQTEQLLKRSHQTIHNALECLYHPNKYGTLWKKRTKSKIAQAIQELANAMIEIDN